MDGFLVLPVTDTSNLFAVGVSQHSSFKHAAVMIKRTAGTIMATRQAVSAAIPELTMGLKRTLIMKICVTPPPRFPHPAAVAFAVPITLGANIKEHQNWLVTKVAPASGAE